MRQLSLSIVPDSELEEIPSEFRTAMAFTTESDNADFVGTVNGVRYMNMAGAMVQAMDTVLSPRAFVMPIIDTPSNSNIAFASKVGGGTMVLEIALPKEHLLEIKAAGEIFKQKMLEAQQQARETAAKVVAEAAADANNLDDVDDATIE